MTTWQTPSSVPTLKKNEVHIWRAELAVSPQQLQEYSTLLNSDETKRARRFHFDIHRNRFTAARAMLRLLLGRYLNCSPQEIIFKYESHGKPTIENNALELQFNVSHSDNYFVAAFTLNHLIGIDIEEISDRAGADIAERFFSASEYEAMMRLPEQEQQNAFFHIWTQKEAFIKAIGQGLSFPLKDFIVSIQAPAKLISIKNASADDWHMQDFFTYSNFATAFATQQKVNHVKFFNFSELNNKTF
ncbi:MAG: 4'-phosphopantetheinyl transferase superfamily protein [Proteobacteria bacterium]|nr:4'-phosphopantetheinyl transferase superfamily protein [Pseudomonadota bacterium]